jgi:hypothetical protein
MKNSSKVILAVAGLIAVGLGIYVVKKSKQTKATVVPADVNPTTPAPVDTDCGCTATSEMNAALSTEPVTYCTNVNIMLRPDVVMSDSNNDPVAGMTIRGTDSVDILDGIKQYLLGKYSYSGSVEAITEVEQLMKEAIFNINCDLANLKADTKATYVVGESTIMISRMAVCPKQ